jgi:hypothetical protein
MVQHPTPQKSRVAKAGETARHRGDWSHPLNGQTAGPARQGIFLSGPARAGGVESGLYSNSPKNRVPIAKPLFSTVCKSPKSALSGPLNGHKASHKAIINPIQRLVRQVFVEKSAMQSAL